MAQMKGLVGIGRRIFNHHEWCIVADGLYAKVWVSKDTLQLLDPRTGIDGEVEESFNDIELCHERLVGHEPFADGLS